MQNPIDNQRILVEGVEYEIVDSIQDFRAEDSFIHRTNKLAQYNGKGESKKHIGSYFGESGDRLSAFFEYDRWGTPHYDELRRRKSVESARASNAVVQDRTCFFTKSNLLRYLRDAEEEYRRQEQHYHHNISLLYQDRLNEIEQLEDEINSFTIYDASDNLGATQNRGYIRSDDRIWKIWRKLVLPKISYLSILKLRQVEGDMAARYFFRILLDYEFRSFVHATGANDDVNEEPEDLERRRQNRIGGLEFRNGVLRLMPQCPFTEITDERLLIASHIKPYRSCIAEQRMDQAIDPNNGLTLTPTYDKLFDQGYITFLDDGQLVCGTQLSRLSWQRLNINPRARNVMRIYPEDRREYLEWHRRNVFLDRIEDLTGNN